MKLKSWVYTLALWALLAGSSLAQETDYAGMEPDAANAIQGTIAGRVFLGSRSAIDVDEGAQGERRLRAFTDHDTLAAVSDAPIWLSWDSPSLSILSR